MVSIKTQVYQQKQEKIERITWGPSAMWTTFSEVAVVAWEDRIVVAGGAAVVGGGSGTKPPIWMFLKEKKTLRIRKDLVENSKLIIIVPKRIAILYERGLEGSPLRTKRPWSLLGWHPKSVECCSSKKKNVNVMVILEGKCCSSRQNLFFFFFPPFRPILWHTLFRCWTRGLCPRKKKKKVSGTHIRHLFCVQPGNNTWGRKEKKTLSFPPFSFCPGTQTVLPHSQVCPTLNIPKKSKSAKIYFE